MSAPSSFPCSPLPPLNVLLPRSRNDGKFAAQGSTNLIPAIEMVKEYSQCDGVYLFSDGLMNDPMKTLKHVEQWMATAAEAVPPMHTIGFFPINAEGGNGERFLKQIALLTGGTYRVRSRPFSSPPASLPP